MAKKIKMIMAKPGLDGHDRGAKLLARIFAEAGMEVVYTGLRQTPEMIVAAAEQEDADVVGMSSLSGVHNYFFPRVNELLKEKGLKDVLLVGGGIIPEEDYAFLKTSGMAHFWAGHADHGDSQFHSKQRAPTLRTALFKGIFRSTDCRIVQGPVRKRGRVPKVFRP